MLFSMCLKSSQVKRETSTLVCTTRFKNNHHRITFRRVSRITIIGLRQTRFKNNHHRINVQNRKIGKPNTQKLSVIKKNGLNRTKCQI